LTPINPATLLTIAAIGVALVVVLITWARTPAFLALAMAALFVGLATRMPLADIPRAFQAGMGDTLGSIAMVIALGTVIGKLLAESGGAIVVSNALARALGERRLDWALMLSGFIIGLPVFFQVGLVLLAPVLFTAQRQSRRPLLWLGLPMVAGLSAAHGLVPPHPGPIAALERLGADPGRTLFYSLILGLPLSIISGPLFSRYVAPRLHVEPGMSSFPRVHQRSASRW
jgi:GntP family gluconate:H+ symporter